MGWLPTHSPAPCSSGGVSPRHGQVEVSSQSLVRVGARPLLRLYCSRAVSRKTVMIPWREHTAKPTPAQGGPRREPGGALRQLQPPP